MQILLLHNAEMDEEDLARGARLKRARERRFETAKAAADYFGMPYTTLAHHEAGTRGVKDKDLRRYARVYGVELPWLRWNIGEMTAAEDHPLSLDEERLIREAYKVLVSRASKKPPKPGR